MEKNIEILNNYAREWHDTDVAIAIEELLKEYKKLKTIESNYNAMRLLNYYNERLNNGENADDLLDEAHNLFNNKEDK